MIKKKGTSKTINSQKAIVFLLKLKEEISVQFYFDLLAKYKQKINKK